MQHENGIVSNLSINSMNTLYYDPLPYHALGVNIFIPDPAQVKSIYEKEAADEFPYWSKVWPSSLALAQWVHDNNQYVMGKRIFEVGAGLGFPSFLAAKYATSVLVSDLIPLAVEWMKFNISQRDDNIIGSMCFDWRTRPLPEADMVLMSDVGYHEEDFKVVHEPCRGSCRAAGGIPGPRASRPAWPGRGR